MNTSQPTTFILIRNEFKTVVYYSVVLNYLFKENG